MEAVAAVGVASAAATFANVAITTLRNIKDCLQSAEGAPAWVLGASKNISEFIRILEGAATLKAGVGNTDITGRLERCLENCAKQAVKLQDILDGLAVKPNHGSLDDTTAVRVRHMMNKVKKAFITVRDKERIIDQIKELETSKANLQLELNALNLSASLDTRHGQVAQNQLIDDLGREISDLRSEILRLKSPIETINYHLTNTQEVIRHIHQDVTSFKSSRPHSQHLQQKLDDQIALIQEESMQGGRTHQEVVDIKLLCTRILQEQIAARQSPPQTEVPADITRPLIVDEERIERANLRRVLKQQCPPHCLCRCHRVQASTHLDGWLSYAYKIARLASSLLLPCSSNLCRTRKHEWIFQTPSGWYLSYLCTPRMIRLGLEMNSWVPATTVFTYPVVNEYKSPAFDVVRSIEYAPSWCADIVIRRLQQIFDNHQGSPRERSRDGKGLLYYAVRSAFAPPISSSSDHAANEARKLIKFLIQAAQEVGDAKVSHAISINYREVVKTHRSSLLMLLEVGWEPLVDFNIQSSNLGNFDEFALLCSYYCDYVLGPHELLDAVLRNDYDSVDRLIRAKADINARTYGTGETAFQLALRLPGRNQITQRIFMELVDQSIRDSSGDTLLQTAIRIGNLASTEQLFRAGADMTMSTGYTREWVEVFRRGGEWISLIERWQNHVNFGRLPWRKAEIVTPLALCVSFSILQGISWILERGGDVNEVTRLDWPNRLVLELTSAPFSRFPDHITLLQLATTSREPLKTVSFLLSRRPDLERRSCNDLTALLYGCGWEGNGKDEKLQTDLAQALLKAGADIEARTTDGATPLLLSADTDNTMLFHHLLDAGANPEAVDKHGNTALHLCARRNNVECSQRLLEKGVNIEAVNNDGKSPLAIAFESIHEGSWEPEMSMVESLLLHGANPDTSRPAGSTPLTYCCVDGNLEGLRLLLRLGANPNSPNRNGLSPLYYCMSDESLSCAEALIESGAEVDRLCNLGHTPLTYCCVKGNLEMLRLLLRSGANPNRPDANGRPPLYHCLSNELFSLADELIKSGAEVDRLFIPPPPTPPKAFDIEVRVGLGDPRETKRFLLSSLKKWQQNSRTGRQVLNESTHFRDIA